MSTSSTGSTLGKILAGAFLHDFREAGMTGPQLIQKGLGKLRKYIGKDEAKALIDESQEMHTALLYCCFDYTVLNKITPETKKMLTSLSASQRVVTETLYMKATGQPNGRWTPPLWRLKEYCEIYTEMSPTEVTPEELLATLKEVFLPAFVEIVSYVKKNI